MINEIVQKLTAIVLKSEREYSEITMHCRKFNPTHCSSAQEAIMLLEVTLHTVRYLDPRLN